MIKIRISRKTSFNNFINLLTVNLKYQKNGLRKNGYSFSH